MKQSRLIAVVSLGLMVLALGVPGAAAGAGLPAGGGWTWLNPTPQGNDLTDVEFVSPTHGWAVGPRATLLETSDGGATWLPRDSGVPPWLGFDAIDFAGATHGWVVGAGVNAFTSDGVVARTSDGGLTWDWQIAAPNAALLDVVFADSSNGWACGYPGVLLRTTDGGGTWVTSPTPAGDDYSRTTFDTLAMSGAGHLWALSSPLWISEPAPGTVPFHTQIIETTDGGQSWLGVDRPWQCVDDIAFRDATHGWMTGRSQVDSPGIVSTTDGGASWTGPSATGMPLDHVRFRDGSNGLATSDASIVRTSNGGTAWTPVAAATSSGGFAALAFGDATHACAVGPAGETTRSTDSGATWQRSGGDALAADEWLAGVSIVDATHAWAVGGAGAGFPGGTADVVMFTSDGGSTWARRDAGVATGLCDVDFVDAQKGWAAGQGVVVATTDGGLHWAPQAADADQPGGWVCFADAAHGWTGSAAGVLRTTDGGAHWSPANALAAHGFSFSDAQHGWAIGDAGIVRTTNGGTTWKTVRVHRRGEVLNDLWFADAQHGWAVGYWGLSDPYFNTSTLIDIVLATTDGGATWTPQDPGSAAALTGVCFADAQHGWATGVRGGTVVGTSDGGATWVQQTAVEDSFAAGVPNTVGAAVSFADAARGMAVNDRKVIGATAGGSGPAPVTSASGGSDVGWVNDDTTVHFAAVPGPSGDPVASTQYLIDPLDDWQTGADCVVAAPDDHSNDGTHKVRYRSIDTAGHTELPRVHQVNVDTRRPHTYAPRSATVRRGRVVTLKFRVWDERPSAGVVSVTIKIKNPARRVVKTLKYRNVECLEYAFRNTLKSFRVPRTWKAGTYRFYVYATDPAGNTQANIALNRLVVK